MTPEQLQQWQVYIQLLAKCGVKGIMLYRIGAL